ncbi:class I SAM-dependent methyltransferase [Ktedonosporobacter rubrisoli]|nr:methyltransferase domain-containing protein [Ktedonosporobacter rubrisoli]
MKDISHTPSPSDTPLASTPADDGRNYLPDIPYTLPKDAQEDQRLNLQHNLLREAFGGNLFVPVLSPRTILDVGCGTGRWLMEVASEFPDAQLTGVDLLFPPALQEPGTLPSNCTLTTANVLTGLPFPDASFEVVHQRLLAFALPEVTWPGVVAELVRVTRPGGWIELVESAVAYRQMGPVTTRHVEWLVETCKQRGIDCLIASRLDILLEKAGLSSVNVLRKTIPLGQWGGRLGKMALANMLAAKQTGKKLITTQLGISTEEYDRSVGEWLQECERFHTCMEFFLVSAQRPDTE